MAKDKQHEHRDRDPECPEQPQPKRAFELGKDYFALRRFRFDFGREFNVGNYWFSAALGDDKGKRS